MWNTQFQEYFEIYSKCFNNITLDIVVWQIFLTVHKCSSYHCDNSPKLHFVTQCNGECLVAMARGLNCANNEYINDSRILCMSKGWYKCTMW